MPDSVRQAPSLAGDLFVGGEMGAHMAALDWSLTPLGPIEGWPQSLRTAVSILLLSRFPMIIFWGPELVQLYNDDYSPILAAKHPAALPNASGCLRPRNGIQASL